MSVQVGLSLHQNSAIELSDLKYQSSRERDIEAQQRQTSLTRKSSLPKNNSTL